METQAKTIPMSSTPAVQDVDSVVVEGAFDKLPKKLDKILQADNVLNTLDERTVITVKEELLRGIADDELSMQTYLEKYQRAIEMAQMVATPEDKTFPFFGASKVMMPYVMQAAIDFNSRATPDLLESGNVVEVKINGIVTGETMDSLDARGHRISTMINYELCEGIPNWRDDCDKANLVLPIVGTTFDKLWQCPLTQKRKSKLIFADKLIFDHNCDDFSTCHRKTHDYVMTQNECVTAMRIGQFAEFSLDAYEDGQDVEMMESHCLIDLDEDGYAEPYIVNIEKSTETIVSIVRRYDEYDVQLNNNNEVVQITGEEFFVQTIFIPDPGGSCMGLGWGILLYDLYETITTNTRQMIDAGTLQNISANSGFVRSGATSGPRARNRQRKEALQLIMGQFTTVESYGNSPLQNDFVQLPFAGPSETLFQLLEALKQEAQRLTTSVYYTENVTNESPEIYLSRLQQSLKIPNSIMMRVYSGKTKIFKRIYDLHYRYLSDDEYENILNIPDVRVQEDYENASYDITPTADPSQGTEQERMAKALWMYNEAKALPQLWGLRECAMRVLKVMKVPGLEMVLPEPQPDPQAQQQQEYMKLLAENERIEAQSKAIEAQASLMKSQVAAQKAEAEIEKLVSETLKNLSAVDKNERDTILNVMKQRFEEIRGTLNEATLARKVDNDRLARESNNASVSRQRTESQ